MPFQKRDSKINRAGRTKGTPNKSTAKLRETIELIQAENLDYIQAHLRDLTLKERLQLNRDLLPFIAPKYASVTEIQKDELQFTPIEVKIIHSTNENKDLN
jgi:hypothetical protein